MQLWPPGWLVLRWCTTGRQQSKVAFFNQLEESNPGLLLGFCFCFLFSATMSHIEVPQLGIKSKPELRPMPLFQQCGSLTHSATLGIKLVPLQRQARSLTYCITVVTLFWPFGGMQNFPGQGSNPHHGINLSHTVPTRERQ